VSRARNDAASPRPSPSLRSGDAPADPHRRLATTPVSRRFRESENEPVGQPRGPRHPLPAPTTEALEADAAPEGVAEGARCVAPGPTIGFPCKPAAPSTFTPPTCNKAPAASASSGPPSSGRNEARSAPRADATPSIDRVARRHKRHAHPARERAPREPAALPATDPCSGPPASTDDPGDRQPRRRSQPGKGLSGVRADRGFAPTGPPSGVPLNRGVSQIGAAIQCARQMEPSPHGSSPSAGWVHARPGDHEHDSVGHGAPSRKDLMEMCIEGRGASASSGSSRRRRAGFDRVCNSSGAPSGGLRRAERGEARSGSPSTPPSRGSSILRRSIRSATQDR
jgi:hypothetical protein